MAYQQSRTSCHNHGVVLIMVVAILATLALAGTAFVVIMGQESKAASSTLYLAQAELAARSGLEHAIGVIDASMTKLQPGGDWLAVTPDGILDDDGVTFISDETAFEDATFDCGWHRFFETEPPTSLPDPTKAQLSNPANWVSHYGDGETYGAASSVVTHAMWGRVIDFPSDAVTRYGGQYAVCVTDLDGKLHANIAAWKGAVGFDGDPDGDSVFELADLKGMVAAIAMAADPDDPTDPDDLYITDAQADLLGMESSALSFSSISEIARRAGVMTPQEKYALERLFTPHPVPGSDDPTPYEHDGSPAFDSGTGLTTATITTAPPTVDGGVVGMAALFRKSGRLFGIASNVGVVWKFVGNCEDSSHGTDFLVVPRPAVNVNTAPEALLAELFKPIPSFDVTVDPDGDDKAEALAKRICERRPFANRHELEDAIFRVVGNQDAGGLPILWVDGNGAVENLPDVDTGLTERQFNDVLNSIAGVLQTHESAFDEPLTPGVYSFDGWEPFGDFIGPAQEYGACSDRNGAPGVSPENVTWSTELKFNSRFFHIYVIGRAWNENTGEPTGVKRLHAVYDSRPPAGIIWLRWNLSSRGSLTDM